MAVTIKKINILPIKKAREVQYLCDELTRVLKPAQEFIDSIGINYVHENPWQEEYLRDPKYYVYRIHIGAIGRINTCKDAVLLGIMYPRGGKDISTWAFTSGALFRVYKLTKLLRRNILMQRDLEKWLNEFITDAHGQNNARFLNLNNMENPTYV